MSALLFSIIYKLINIYLIFQSVNYNILVEIKALIEDHIIATTNGLRDSLVLGQSRVSNKNIIDFTIDGSLLIA